MLHGGSSGDGGGAGGDSECLDDVKVRGKRQVRRGIEQTLMPHNIDEAYHEAKETTTILRVFCLYIIRERKPNRYSYTLLRRAKYT